MSARDEMAWARCTLIGSYRCADAGPCEYCFEQGDKIIAALAAAGLSIAPTVPTARMVTAGQKVREDGDTCFDIWSTMLAASSPRPPIGEV